MTPSVESLAALLGRFDCAMLTLVDAEGRPHTRLMQPIKAPFNGHLWFRLGDDDAAIDAIGRGAEVAIAYGASDQGPYVAVCGWGIVLRTAPLLRSVWRAAGPSASASPALAEPLVCVRARAAEVWDTASTASRRVFAFGNAYPVCQPASRTHERAFTPRLVARSMTPCAP
jgi:general stress protein 26